MVERGGFPGLTSHTPGSGFTVRLTESAGTSEEMVGRLVRGGEDPKKRVGVGAGGGGGVVRHLNFLSKTLSFTEC